MGKYHQILQEAGADIAEDTNELDKYIAEQLVPLDEKVAMSGGLIIVMVSHIWLNLPVNT